MFQSLNKLTGTLALTATALALTACGGPGAYQPSKSNPFSAYYLPKAEVEELSATGKLLSLCPELVRSKEPVLNARVISRAGTVFQLNPAIGDVRQQVAIGRVDDAGNMQPSEAAQAKAQASGYRISSVKLAKAGNQMLMTETRADGASNSKEYLQVSKPEALRYYDVQTGTRPSCAAPPAGTEPQAGSAPQSQGSSLKLTPELQKVLEGRKTLQSCLTAVTEKVGAAEVLKHDEPTLEKKEENGLDIEVEVLRIDVRKADGSTETVDVEARSERKAKTQDALTKTTCTLSSPDDQPPVDPNAAGAPATDEKKN